jgi:hypothetical protein
VRQQVQHKDSLCLIVHPGYQPVLIAGDVADRSAPNQIRIAAHVSFPLAFSNSPGAPPRAKIPGLPSLPGAAARTVPARPA